MAARRSVCQASLRASSPRLQPRLDGKNNRHAHDEEKRGKNQIGGREAVPRGVVHLRPCAVAAVVVHHDHEGDGEAAQHVERKQPFGAPEPARGAWSWSIRPFSVNRECTYATRLELISPSLQTVCSPGLSTLRRMRSVDPASPAATLALQGFRSNFACHHPEARLWPNFSLLFRPIEHPPEFTFRALLLGSHLRPHLRRRHRLCRPARRTHRRRFHSHRGAFHQHSARLRPRFDS